MPPGGRGRLLALSWAHLLNDGASNYLPGVLPAILVALGEPVSVAGALMAALIVGQALQPTTGWLADRIGGNGLTVVGLLLSSVGGGLLGFVPSTGLLVLALLIIGAGGAMFHPQALAGVRSVAGGRVAFVTSVFLVGGEFGRGLWPTVASFLVVHLGMHWLWLVGLPGVLTAPFLLRFAPKLLKRAGHGARVQWSGRRGVTASLVAYRGVQAFTTYVFVTFVPILWHLRGKSLVTGASVITVMVTVGILGNLAGGHLSDRIGRRPVLVVSSLMTAACLLPTVYLSGVWVWIFAALVGMSVFFAASTTVLIGQDIFPENRSMGSGMALGLTNAIGSVLVLLVGFAVGGGDLVDVFWLVAILSAASTALAFTFPRALLVTHTHELSRA
jgi:FSR family fosmidomycin resistance protein-like MFS transporter